MNPLARFLDLYFAFLLSGNVKDFSEAHQAMARALQTGATLEDVQHCMDCGHTSAELMVVLTDSMKDGEHG